jgi:hypothetical protein
VNPADGQPRRSRPKVGDVGDARYRALADREIIHIRRPHFGLAALGGVWALLAVAGIFLLHPLPSLLTWFESKSWPAVSCQVTLGAAQPAGAASEAPPGDGIELKYAYKFGDKDYEATTWSPGQPNFEAAEDGVPKTEVAELIGQLQTAQTCYVNPANPSEAVLDRTYPVAAGEELAALVLVGILPGVVGIVQGARKH